MSTRYTNKFAAIAATFRSLRDAGTQFHFYLAHGVPSKNFLPYLKSQHLVAQKAVRRSPHPPRLRTQAGMTGDQQSMAWGNQPARALTDGVEAARLLQLELASTSDL